MHDAALFLGGHRRLLLLLTASLSARHIANPKTGTPQSRRM